MLLIAFGVLLSNHLVQFVILIKYKSARAHSKIYRLRPEHRFIIEYN